jgi:hypothetical protein
VELLLIQLQLEQEEMLLHQVVIQDHLQFFQVLHQQVEEVEQHLQQLLELEDQVEEEVYVYLEEQEIHHP